MPDYTLQELCEALRAIDSIIHKCEKAQEKFPEGNSHHTLLKNRLKAMYISKALIAEALAKKSQKVPVDNTESGEPLLSNLARLHTTALGAERIRKNLALRVDDVALWCREKTQSPNCHITRTGKNWYILVDDCEITVNAHSYTIITAHQTKKKYQEVSK